MMYLLATFIVGFLCIRLMVAVLNLISRPWLRELKGAKTSTFPQSENDIKVAGSGDPGPMVSILIPARNEAGNIETLLESLSAFYDTANPMRIEVIVYDDQSEDQTAPIVDEFCRTDKRFRLIRGKTLPDGWLGKNHACHQLALLAKGKYLLFLDADVGIRKGLIETALAHLQKYDLVLLSIFPQQIMKSWGERITVPLMNWILVSLLPLILTRISPWPSFAAANGQFMLFDAPTYHQYRFHQLVKQHKVEDILVFRMMKRMGLKVQTLLGNEMITCRMYNNFSESVLGFSRNVYAFFGGSVTAGLVFAMITTLGFIPVWYTWDLAAAMLYLLGALLLRVMVSLSSHQPPIQNILLAPLQQMAFLVVIIVALYKRCRKNTSWKGRMVDV
jgi:glycosyltransferase involved in cell wall biosynthesis